MLKIIDIKTVLFRILPNVKNQTKEGYLSLLKDKMLTSYFKGTSRPQEYPGLYKIFSECGFDMSLSDTLRKTLPDARKMFLENVKSKFNSFSDSKNFKGMCCISQGELDFALSTLDRLVFPGKHKVEFVLPTLSELLANVKWSASMGLPTPWIKKRQLRSSLEVMYLEFLKQRLSITNLFKYPTAAFVRYQIRQSGLKARVVEAINVYISFIESWFMMLFKSGLDPLFTSICIGLPQRTIQQRIKALDQYYVYSIDYSKWDELRQPVLSIIAFEWMIKRLPLNAYQQGTLRNLYRNYLTSVMFHPTIDYGKRYIGTVSGSGFTSVDNSLCNHILISIMLHSYFKKIGINPETVDFDLLVCGDDLVVASSVELDIERIFKMSEARFGVKMRLECPVSLPGSSHVVFLGSEWKDYLPYRQEKVLVASVIFGSRNFPMMDTDELLQSRFIEIFGNVCNTKHYFDKLKRKLRSRFFFFYELYRPEIVTDFSNTRKYIQGDIDKLRKQSKDNRGFWYNVNLTREDLDHMWSTR